VLVLLTGTIVLVLLADMFVLLAKPKLDFIPLLVLLADDVLVLLAKPETVLVLLAKPKLDCIPFLSLERFFVAPSA